MGFTPTFMNEVLTWPSRDVEAWLDTVVVGEPVNGEDFNWLGLAEGMSTIAGLEGSLSWARASARVYEGLAARSSSRDGFSFRYSAMYLRVRMIGSFGVKAGDSILDPEHIVAWFESVASVSLAEAKRLVAWPELYSLKDGLFIHNDVVLMLRHIKNALGPLSSVAETDAVRARPDLMAWLRFRKRLP